MPDDRRSVGVRVRPNSHDFIRQLRADLAGKKYTFTVDVKADTKPATRDVRTWANTELKKVNAVVGVRANTGPATRDVAQWREKVRNQGAVDIKVGADLSRANREVEAWRAAMGRPLDIKVKADMSARGVEAIRRAVSKDATVKVRADTTDAKRKIQDLSNQPGLFDIEIDAKTNKAKAKVNEFITSTQGEQIELDLGLDTKKAQAQAQEFKTKAKALTVSQQLDLDTKKARRDLALLKLKIATEKATLKVDVETSKLDRFSDRLKDIERQTGSLTVLRSLDLGPLTLGKPTGLVGTLATVTALAGALPGAVTGIAALSDAMMRLAGAASIVPGALAAIGTSIATIALGTSGISDTFGAMFDMWNEGSKEQAKQATNLVVAHNNYRNAIVDEQRAQQEVSRARRDSLHDLRDLNNELRGGVLNEAQSLLDLQKARDRLAQGGFKTQTEYLQAVLDVRKGEQNVMNTREDNIKTQEKANEANAKGVENSDKVQQALEAQTRAAQQTAEAAQKLSDAQTVGSTATSKFQDALSQLSPNAQDFVMTIAGMKDELYGFRNAIQDTIFQGTGPAFQQMFDNLMPVIGPGMQQVAQGLNQNIMQVFDSLQTPEGQSIIERILGGTAETQKAITKLIDPMVRGFGTLMAAGAEHMPQLVDLMTRLADRFANFIETADKSGALDKFMDEGITALSNLAETGINLVKIMNDFSTAFRSAFGEDLLTMIARVTGEWHNFLSSPKGQQKLLDFIEKAKEIWNDWQPILKDLPELFGKVSEAASNALNVILPALNTITSALAGAPGLVEAFASVWILGKMVSAGTTIVNLGKTLWGMSSAIVTMIRNVPQLASKLATLAMPNLGAPTNPAPGTPPVAGAAGSALGGAAAVAGYLAIPTAVGLGVADQAAAAGVGTGGQLGAFGAGAGVTPIPGGAAVLTLLMRDPDFARKVFGSAQENAGRKLLDAVWAKFEERGKTQDDATKIYGLGANPNMSREQLEALARLQAGANPSFAFGGYTDWGIANGRMAELHGGEYVQPQPTVAYYGKDAMEAVHKRKATIAYDKGGGVPMAHPNDPWNPDKYKQWGEPDYGWGWADTGTWINRPSGPGSGGFRVAPGPGVLPPWARPTPGEPPVGGQPAYRERIGRALGQAPWGYQEGGLVYDPLTGQYVQTGAAVSHGVNPAVQEGQGLLNTLATGVTAGVAHAGQVASQVYSQVSGLVQQAAPQAPGIPATPDAAISPFGVTGAPPGPGPGIGATAADALISPFGVTGALPGPTAVSGTPTTATPTISPYAPGARTTGSPFGDALLGSFGLPGFGGGQAGPGWGPMGAPPGLGGQGGPIDPLTGAPLDIRNFGIGPGPPGSGPFDWAAYAGTTLGKFGAGLFTALAQGALDFVGLGGIMQSPYFQAATGLGAHFAGANAKADTATIQDPSALATNEAVQNLLDTYGGMPVNPAYPGVPTMPNVVDMGTGSAIALPPGQGVGPYGPIPYDTKNPKLSILSYLKGLAGQAGIRAGSGPSDKDVADALGIPTHFRDRGWHPKNQAMDIGNGPDAVPLATWWISDPSRVAATKELILQAPGWDPMNNIKDGKFIRDYGGGVYDAGTLKGHDDHMHLALGNIPNIMAAGVTQALLPYSDSINPTSSSVQTPTVQPTDWWGGWRPAKQGSAPNPLLQLAGGTGGNQPGNPLFGPLTQKLDKATLKQVAHRMYLESGMPPGEWGDFDKLIEKESGWDPTAKNPSSTAFGLGQFLDFNRAAYGIGDTTNPLAQLPAIFRYLRERSDYKGSPARAWALWNSRRPHWYKQGGLVPHAVMDSGGWLMPGTTVVHNYTGKPEMVVPSFQGGGFATGVVPGFPRPPDIIQKQPTPPPKPAPAPAPRPAPRPVQPAPTVPAVPPTAAAPPIATPPTPTVPHEGTGAAPGPPPGPSRAPVIIGGGQRETPDVKDIVGDHVHPALRKGITSGFAAAGNAAATAMQIGAAILGAAGGAGAAGSFGGSLGANAGAAALGGMSSYVAGLFTQAGKIANNVANVGSSFLVGNITGGTTDNPYGVTQRGSIPSGAGGVVDNRNVHNGDIYTNNLDEYMKMVDRRNAQRAQSGLGRWGSA